MSRQAAGSHRGRIARMPACAALRELIERDAMIEWRAAGPLAAIRAVLNIDMIPYGWLRTWRHRLEMRGISIRLYRLPSVTRIPVFACELNDLSRPGVAYRATHGSGCHHDPEIAVFRAVAEAIQSRATFIAGARDDLGEDDFAAPAAGEAVVAFALPAPDGGQPWEDARVDSGLDSGLDRLVGALADAGLWPDRADAARQRCRPGDRSRDRTGTRFADPAADGTQQWLDRMSSCSAAPRCRPTRDCDGRISSSHLRRRQETCSPCFAIRRVPLR